jgi:hypothetical protein
MQVTHAKLEHVTQANLERYGESNALHKLARQIEAEYVEMPGLSVTLPQAQRLWTADGQACRAVFDQLVACGVLRMTMKGRFIRA